MLLSYKSDWSFDWIGVRYILGVCGRAFCVDMHICVFQVSSPPQVRRRQSSADVVNASKFWWDISSNSLALSHTRVCVYCCFMQNVKRREKVKGIFSRKHFQRFELENEGGRKFSSLSFASNLLSFVNEWVIETSGKLFFISFSLSTWITWKAKRQYSFQSKFQMSD